VCVRALTNGDRKSESFFESIEMTSLETESADADVCYKLFMAFEIPDRMIPSIQMMSVLQQCWERFKNETTPIERQAAFDWFRSWVAAQIEKE
jgi:hypothetical protein